MLPSPQYLMDADIFFFIGLYSKYLKGIGISIHRKTFLKLQKKNVPYTILIFAKISPIKFVGLFGAHWNSKELTGAYKGSSLFRIQGYGAQPSNNFECLPKVFDAG